MRGKRKNSFLRKGYAVLSTDPRICKLQLRHEGQWGVRKCTFLVGGVGWILAGCLLPGWEEFSLVLA